MVSAKKVYIFSAISIVLLFIGLLYYEGILNPRKIIIDNMVIETPNNYALLSAYINYKKIDITCNKRFRCNKKILINKNRDIVILDYYKFFSSKQLRIAIQKIPHNKVNDIVYTHQSTLKKIGKCFIERKLNKKSTEYKIYQYDTNSIKEIYIISTEDIIAKKILEGICDN